MDFTGKKVLNKMVAIIAILAITMSDFILVGTNLVSYAIDMTKATVDNVEIASYFVEENGEKVSKVEKDAESEDLKMYVEISVKNEGYFDGEISLGNANFKIKDKVLSENVNKIEGNTVYLNRINAGKSVVIELEIEEYLPSTMKETLLSMESEVILTGKYTDSKEVHEISGKSGIEVDWKTSEETKAETTLELLTNKVYKIQGISKHVVQLLFTSKVTNNNYPVKNTKIDINVPQGAEEVTVTARSTQATNGNTIFNSDNYSYDENEETLTINVKNEADTDGNIKFQKNAQDEFIVTYIYPENATLTDITANTTITTYDSKELQAESKVTIDEEKDGIVTYSIESTENEIYKGKIYTGEDRTIESKTEINVNKSDLIEKININQMASCYVAESEYNANIFFNQTKILKSEFENIFGEEGYIKISDSNGTVIANITKESQADENDYVVINHAENTKEFKIETSKPIIEGTLNIKNTKTIKETEYDRAKIGTFNQIKEVVSGSYNNAASINAENKITLKETTSKATLNVSNTTFSTTESTSTKITVTLDTNDESKDLYKNPTIKITLPKQVKKYNINYGLLHGNGLQLDKQNVVGTKEGENFVITFNLTGEQTKYVTDVTEGATLVIEAVLEQDPLAITSTEEIKLNYTNENAKEYENNAEETIKVDIIAKDPITEEAKLEQSVKATVGADEIKDGDVVKTGEIIKYTVTVRNTGNEDATGVTIVGNIPEGTNYIAYNDDKEMPDDPTTAPLPETLIEDKNKNEVKYENQTIKAKSQKTIEYMVIVNTTNTQESEFKLKTTDSLNNEIITKIKHNLKTEYIKVKIYKIDSVYSPKIKTGYSYRYGISIENTSDEEQRNLNVEIKTNDILELEQAFYLDGNSEVIDGLGKTFTIERLGAGEQLGIVAKTEPKTITNNLKEAEISATVSQENNKVRSNMISESVESILLDVKFSSTSSNESEGYINAGDEVKYMLDIKNEGEIDADMLKIKDQFSDYLELQNITLNNKAVEYEKNEVYGDGANYSILTIESPLKAGEIANVVITAKVKSNLNLSGIVKVVNKAKLDNIIYVAETDEITHLIQGNISELNDSDSQSEENNNNNGENNNSNINTSSTKYTIAGIAWKDENENGARDQGEDLLEGISVKLLNIESKKIVTDSSGNELIAKTNSEGLYTLTNIQAGKYIEIFEYDTSKYMLTTYKADGVQNDKNSDVVLNNITIDEKTEQMATTDTIDLSKNVANIDIGLVDKKEFDLELHKYITKIAVTNSAGTSTYEYKDATLAKVDIAAKNLKDSQVVIEYTIRVKNNGEIAGYVKNIVDYKPIGLDFSSTLNTDWYSQGDNLYNTSLANTKLEPGETKDLKLILTKTMTESNTGLIGNTAEIAEAYNTRGISDKNSIPGNRAKNEDDIGQADVILGVKTGIAISYILITLSIIIAIVILGYIISKNIINKEIKD